MIIILYSWLTILFTWGYKLPYIHHSKSSIEYVVGPIEKNEVKTVVFPSEAKQKSQIEWIKAKCSCNKASFVEAANDKRSAIQVEILGRKKSVGPFREIVNVKYRSQQEVYEYIVSGFVLEDTPSKLELGAIPYGKSASVEFVIHCKGESPCYLKEFQSDEKQITIETVKMSEKYGKNFLYCKLTLLNNAVNGNTLKTVINLMTGDTLGESTESHQITVNGELLPRIIVNPSPISLDVTPAGSSFQKRLVFYDSATEGEKLIIKLEKSSLPSWIQIDTINVGGESNKSSEYIIKGTVQKGTNQAKLAFETNIQGLAIIEVPVWGYGE